MLMRILIALSIQRLMESDFVAWATDMDEDERQKEVSDACVSRL